MGNSIDAPAAACTRLFGQEYSIRTHPISSSGTPCSRTISPHAERDQRPPNPGKRDVQASVSLGVFLPEDDRATTSYEAGLVGRELYNITNAPVDNMLKDFHAMRKQSG
ncbi:unnamed protein product [Heligmosomoides polygyrus]|uniref:Uncharacterized protein n=1 Tax=Heligmosomoides polygyrus TaxID=6339 RepID=A0A183FXR9_HELPZ|nr:unnamed protein product [Heligmosomoides polygyrus]